MILTDDLLKKNSNSTSETGFLSVFMGSNPTISTDLSGGVPTALPLRHFYYFHPIEMSN